MRNDILPVDTVLKEKYRIIEYLHEEAYQSVYRATLIETGETTIIREVKPIDLIYTERLIESIKNLISLNEKKRVTPALELFMIGDIYYAVEECVEDKSLYQLQKNRSISEREMVDIILAVLDALRILHEKDVVHRLLRDISICLLNDGSVRFIDFINSTPGAYKNDKSIMTLSPNYRAPEQYFAHNINIGPWTDIYAIGAIMYKMLTGDRLQEALERKMADTEINITTELKGLDKIILKSIALNHKKRYKNVDAMIRALEKCIKKNM